MDGSVLAQFLITGLSVGSVYALIAVGLVTVYNITGVINFAHGEFVMIGALTCVSLHEMGLGLLPAALLAIVITGLIGGIVERTAIYPARNASFVVLLIITIGVSILFRAFGQLIWGTNPKPLPPFSNNTPIEIFGAVLVPQSIWIFAVLVFLLVLLYVFFEKTVMGSAVKACVINPKAARLMGINISNMSAYSFMVSAALGAVAGIVMTPVTSASYDMGLFLGLKGFVAMVFGGMNNISGAIAGGLMLGVIEAMAGGYISTAYSDAIIFGILLIALFLFPNGLLGKALGKRV